MGTSSNLQPPPLIVTMPHCGFNLGLHGQALELGVEGCE
jgi:hypothetical protein